MIDRVDLLIAVIGIVVSIVGSSTALWMALTKKADKDDLVRLETRLEANIDRLGNKIDVVEARLEARSDSRFNRLEAKLDALILRLAPDQSPQPEN